MSDSVPLYGFGGNMLLNFKIVSYSTEALLKSSEPRTNTIGIVTTNRISNWFLSPVKPENPEEGSVWILIGNRGLCDFDMLNRKNHVIVDPIGAFQFISGEFVRQIAYIYQDEWKQFSFRRLVLFANGDQSLDITGGWNSADYDLSGFNTTRNTKVTIDDAIVCSAVSASSDSGGLCGTANLVNFEGFTKMVAIGKVTGYQSKSRFYVGVNDDKVVKPTPTAMIRLTADGSFEKEMPLPVEVKELYFFTLACPLTSTGDTYTATLTVTEIYLE